MTGELNYGASIPQEAITQAQKEILQYQRVNKDGYFARTLMAQRTLTNANIRKDIIRNVDKVGGEDNIVAKIVEAGTIPDIVGTKRKEVIHQIYEIYDAVLVNENLLNLDPSAWNSDVRVAMLECQRRESYTAINGQSNLGIVGIAGAAAANPLGSVVASGGSGTTTNNQGAWDGSETDHLMDPYEDLRVATGKIDPEFPRSSLYLAGRPAYLNYLWQKNELRETYISEIAGLFGRADGSTDFLVACDYFPANYVYVLAKHPNAAELVMAQDYNIDANYPREKGKNRYAEIGGAVGFEFHNYKGFVRVAIN